MMTFWRYSGFQGLFNRQGELIVKQAIMLCNLVLLLPIFLAKGEADVLLQEKRTLEHLLPPTWACTRFNFNFIYLFSVCFIKVVSRLCKERGRGEESGLLGWYDAISSSRWDGAWPLRILYVSRIIKTILDLKVDYLVIDYMTVPCPPHERCVSQTAIYV